MTGLPDIVIIIDQQEEYTALRVGDSNDLLNRDCDPRISIPANDDALAD